MNGARPGEAQERNGRSVREHVASMRPPWTGRSQAELSEKSGRSGDSEAHRLLRRAYEAIYRFPEGFGGFEAALYYAWDTECRAGTVTVRSPSDIRISGSIRDDVDDARLKRELASIVSHRWPLAYEDGDGRHRLSLEPEEHPLGTLVRVADDGMDSTYRIQGGHIQQIERSVGGGRFSVNIQERKHTTDGRALPAHFCAVHWESPSYPAPQSGRGCVARTDIYRDGYMPVEGVYLPLSRRVITADETGSSIWQIMLRDHRLLHSAENRGAATKTRSDDSGARRQDLRQAGTTPSA